MKSIYYSIARTIKTSCFYTQYQDLPLYYCSCHENRNQLKEEKKTIRQCS